MEEAPGTMIICIADVLDADSLRKIESLLAEGEFVDGRLTAGWHARTVKENRQLAVGEVATEARDRVRAALDRNAIFSTAVLPARFGPLVFSRYEAGMGYGPHVDDALMGGAEPLRSDVSFTLFLSAPEDYEGGALVIETTGGEHSYKLPAGSLIAYPSTTLHRVDPVRAGVRQVAVGWVQSRIRSPERREILFDLDTARRAVFERDGKSSVFDLLAKSYANLVRRWAEA